MTEYEKGVADAISIMEQRLKETNKLLNEMPESVYKRGAEYAAIHIKLLLAILPIEIKTRLKK